jgi:hypothetical protein
MGEIEMKKIILISLLLPAVVMTICAHDQPAKPSAAKLLTAAINEHGLNAAVKTFAELREKSGDFSFNEKEFEELGERLINTQKFEVAAAIFNMNVELFPDSSFVYYNLAMACMYTGNRECAENNFKIFNEKVPNPDSYHAKRILANMDSRLERVAKERERSYKPSEQTGLKGPYLGQKPPGMQAELFAPGIVTTEKNEHMSPSFSPEGTECFWSFWDTGAQYIYTTKIVDGFWVKPIAAHFNGPFREDGAYFSPDGKRVYFYSKRPLPGEDKMNDDWDIWYIEKESENWSNPKHAGFTLNTNANETLVSVTRDYSVYFILFDEKRILYKSEYIGGKYRVPHPLPESINRNLHFSHVYIEPDEKYMIISSNRPGGYGDGDLYISFNENNNWSEPINMGPTINTQSLERAPQVTYDGKYLFFARHEFIDGRWTNGDFYWVDAKIIEELRPNE